MTNQDREIIQKAVDDLRKSGLEDREIRAALYEWIEENKYAYYGSMYDAY